MRKRHGAGREYSRHFKKNCRHCFCFVSWCMEKDEALGKQKTKNTLYYSDYAHHPTEINATLKAFKDNFPNKKLICVFESHQTYRLNRLFSDFVHAFESADKLILLPVYKVMRREEESKRDAFDLAQAIRKKKKETYFVPSWGNADKMIGKIQNEGNTLIVFMGAEDIDANARKFCARLTL